MDNGHRRACRFCMKVIYNEFDVIGEITRRMVDALLLTLNLDNDKENVMCLECATKLQNAVDFKTTCLNRNQKICRFCMKVVESGHYIYLQENKENVFIVDMVQKHIPELSLCVTEELVTCNACLDSLQDFLSFIRNCMNVEEKPGKNMDESKVDDQIQLNDSQEVFTSEFVISCSDADNLAIFQEKCDKSEDYNIMSDEQEIDVTMKTDNVNLNIKKEEIEIKLEQNECESEIAEAAKNNLLPAKSEYRYKITYQRFMEWRLKNDVKSFSENVMMAYFQELSKTMKPSSLWSFYSMLRATININHNVDIANYSKLQALLKRKSDGFKSKKSKILTSKNINDFLENAPDDKYLFMKVALIIGISGACRKQELRNIKPSDIQDTGKNLIINIPDSKTKRQRSFVVSEYFYPKVKKYINFRSAVNTASNLPFFLNYINGKCTRHCVGINKLGNIPKQIAIYLGLPEAATYTGHCFRRSSASILVDAGGDLLDLKRHGGWQSSAVAEGYVDNSLNNQTNNSFKISSAIAKY